MSTNMNTMDAALECIHRTFVNISDNDCSRTKRIFDEILKIVLKEMKAQCNYFRSNCKSVTPSGSVFDKTKVSKLDEFDVDLVINLPISYEDGPNGITIETAAPGYVKLKITNAFDKLDDQPNWENCNKITRGWRDSDKYFLQNKFRNWLHSIVAKALEALKWKVTVSNVTYQLRFKESGPAYTLNIREENKDEIFLNVDLVPVIQFTRPQWPGHCRHHKHLTTQWMAVPKPKKTTKDLEIKNRSWRVSFKEQEKEMMQNRGHLRITLKLVKKMRDSLKLTAIASYYIKTLFLWKADDSDRTFWQQKISVIFREMVCKLRDALKERDIPYYWNEKLNLIEDTKIARESDANDEYVNKLTKVIQCLDANHIYQVIEFLTTPEEFQSIQIEDVFKQARRNTYPSIMLPDKQKGGIDIRKEPESKGSQWNEAKSPNYSLNTDLKFPYSDFPYSEVPNLSQIPPNKNDLIEHVDYWGEGRIVMPGHASGFSESYNINHQHQLVSKGPDAGRKIPNRIPIKSKTECDTSNYIKENSVKLVTVSYIIDSTCAKDIARIINDKVGKVVDFGQNNERLGIELQSKSIIYCYGAELPKQIQNLSLDGPFKIYLNVTDLKTALCNKIINSEFDTAVTMTKIMKQSGRNDVYRETISKLLDDNVENIKAYAYKLWLAGLQDIVCDTFPKQFQHFFSEDNLRTIHRDHILYGGELTMVIRNVHSLSPFGMDLKANELYNHIVNGDFDRAVMKTRTMQQSGTQVISHEFITKLLKDSPKNIMGYAYKLWYAGFQNIVCNDFPQQFKYFFNGERVQIINKMHNLPLKLHNLWSMYGKRAMGDGLGALNFKLSWVFIPIWDNNMVYFKIKKYRVLNISLKTDFNCDHSGVRNVWGAIDAHSTLHQFYIETYLFTNEVLFYIISRDFNQGLKLDDNPNLFSDRLIWAADRSVGDQPEFGWYIVAMP